MMRLWQTRRFAVMAAAGMAALGFVLLAGQFGSVAQAAEQPANSIGEGPSDSPSNIPTAKPAPLKQPAAAPAAPAGPAPKVDKASCAVKCTPCCRRSAKWRCRPSRVCCR